MGKTYTPTEDEHKWTPTEFKTFDIEGMKEQALIWEKIAKRADSAGKLPDIFIAVFKECMTRQTIEICRRLDLIYKRLDTINDNTRHTSEEVRLSKIQITEQLKRKN